MEIEIYKENSSKSGGESEYLKIVGYSFKIKTENLLFFKKETLNLKDNSDVPMLEIHKVQYIASCKTKFEDEILVAFYFGEYSALLGYVISDLPRGYYSSQGHLIDYKSYSDICALTGETKLSLIEYFHSVKEGNCDPNSYIQYKGKYLNSDEHKEVI